MRLLSAVLFCFLLPTCAFANDTLVAGSGGRVHRMKGEHASVRMVSETVRMDIHHNYYDVNAMFVFHNAGRPTTVTMGFPEKGAGGIDPRIYKHKPAFLSFATWVEGKQISARREYSRPGEFGYEAFWVKPVTFARNQRRTVRVKYRSPPNLGGYGERFANYDFTGGNWRGKVDESTLTAVMHTPGTYFVWAEGGLLKREGQRFVFRRKNWEAETSVSVSYMASLPGWMVIDGIDDWFDPPAEARPIARPGQPPTLDWAPPAVMRGGVVFVRLDAMRGLLHGQAEKAGKNGLVALSWDAKAKEAVLQAWPIVIVFRLGRAEMVAGLASPDIQTPLPAKPFVSKPDPHHPSGALYVPLKPVVEALGGTLRVSASRRRVDLDIPPFWSAEGKSAN